MGSGMTYGAAKITFIQYLYAICLYFYINPVNDPEINPFYITTPPANQKEINPKERLTLPLEKKRNINFFKGNTSVHRCILKQVSTICCCTLLQNGFTTIYYV